MRLVKKRKIVKRNDEQGNVLLLSLFVLSSVLIAALGLSVVVLRELRTSQSWDDGNQAYFAAESGLEQALYNIRRAGDAPASQNAVGISLANGSSFDRQAKVGEPVFSLGKLGKDDYVELDLFNPNNLAEVSGIEALKINWSDDCAGASAVELSYTEWLAGLNLQWPPRAGYTGTFWKYRETNRPWLFTNLAGNNNYRLRLKAENCDLKNLEVRAFGDNGGAQAKDVPSRVFVSVTGKYGRAHVALTAAWKRLPPLSGLFNFVLFSEQAIVK